MESKSMGVYVGDRLLCNINGNIIACTVTEVYTTSEESRFWAVWDDDGELANSTYDNIIRKETKLDKALK